MTPGRRRLLRNAVDGAVVLIAVLFLASYFPRNLMLSPTVTNGGDMGSHYQPLQFLHDVLLPQGRVVGWCPGNFCGYPLFQFYFPLPFLVMVGLSGVWPLTVAFKLGTVLGVLLTPVCAYFGLRLLRVPFPGPALGAVSTLSFLFMEANSMWGGNIPSTLAGEFAMSLGLALTLLFFGAVARAAETGRGVAWVGLLEAAIGLSHGYTLLWAGFGSLLELVATRRWWRRLGVLVAVHGLALLLLAFWLVPLAWYAPWTTPYDHAWTVRGWQEVLPPILWPAAGVAVVTAAVVGVLAVVRRAPYPRDLATLWGLMAVAGVFWLTAHSFHVVDIRFVPFVQLGLCLAAGAGLGRLLAPLPGAEVWPLVGAMATLPFVQQHVSFTSSWIRWNYSGYETKRPWPTLQQIAAHLRGGPSDPRVAYEDSPDHEALGTVRVFESLPLFSGRSTLGGLHMQGSPTAPFVFWVQSEVSKVRSCPFPDWGCTRLDLERGAGHLRMMNVGQLLLRSDAAKKEAARTPGLEREATFGDYEVWRVRDNAGRYAVPLERAPYLVVGRDWKAEAYRWFKRAAPDDAVPVFADAAGAGAEAVSFAAVVPEVPDDPPHRPLPPPPALRETVTSDRITVTGCTPGHPVLVRVSYHPRWRALGGERVWLAGPSFMLVFPHGETVELVFGDPPVMVAARIASLLGLGVLLVAGTRLGRRLAPALARAGRALAGTPPLRPLSALVTRSASWTPARRRLAVGAFAGAGVAVVAAAALAAWRPPASRTYRAAMALYDAGKLDEAVPALRAAQAAAPLASSAAHAAWIEGTIHLRRQRPAEAEDAFRRLVRSFPESENAPEAYYQIGLVRLQRGERDGAVQAWRTLRARHPDSRWARSAAERLREAGVEA